MAGSRKLVVEFVGDTASLEKSFGRVRGESDKTGGKLSKLQGPAKAAGIALGVGLAGAVKVGFDELAESQKVAAQTAAVLKSTGGVANVTARQVENLAGSISRKTGIDDEQIQAGQNMLLTFTKLRNETGKGNDVFNQATKITTDLSVAMGKDMQSSAVLVGKALNDPVKGVTALTKAGVQLTEGQKKQVAALVEAGDTMGAQKIILKELETQFGGSAEAAGKTFPGQLSKLKNSFEEVAGALVATLLPAFQSLAGIGAKVSAFFQENPGLAKVLGAALVALTGVLLSVSAATKLAGAATALWSGVTKAAAAAQWLLNAALSANPIALVIIGLAALAAGLVGAYQKSETFRNIVNAVGGAMVDAATAVVGFVTDIEGIPGRLLEAGNWIVEKLIEGVKAMPAALLEAATWVKDRVIDGVKAYISLYVSLGSWLVHRLVDGVKAVPAVLAAAAAWVKDRLIEGVKLYLETYKSLGGWLVHRLVDGVKALPGVVLGVGGWVKNRLGEGLNLVVGGITGLGGWVLRRVVEGLKATPDLLLNIGEWIKNRLMDGLRSIVDGVKGIGGWIIEKIVAGLKGGANLLVDFLNEIIKVVNKIPGVKIGEIAKFAAGGVNQFAHGGAFGRTGGLVDRPMVMMGEEAPRHPEFVIPTNPAYRSRAQALLAQAAGAVGMQAGGINQYNHVFPRHSLGQPGARLSPDVVKGIAETAGLPGRTFEQIAHGESDYYPGVVSSDGGWGLWQMTPRVWGAAAIAAMNRLGGLGQMLNPFRNAQMARFLYDDAGGISPWYGTKYVTDGDGGGVVESISDVISGLVGSLPSPGALPDWIKGLGKHVLDKVTGWMKDQLGGVVGGGAGIGGQVKGTMKMAQTIAKKFALSISSGWRSVEHNAAVGGVEGSLHTHGTAANPGAIDLVGSIEAMNAASAWAAQNLNLVENLIHDVGSGLHLHLGFFKKGGLFGGAPFLGAYRDGGTLPADGLYYGHAGETITPAGKETVVQVNFASGMEWLREFVDVRIVEQDRHTSRTYRAGVAPA